MSGQIAGEGWFMLHSFLLGACITLFYDLFRILRRIIPHRTLLLSLEDLIFWILATAGIFYLLYYENNGMFRWFSVIGAGAGMLLYKNTLSAPFVSLISGLINRILALLGKFLWKLTAPFRFLWKKGRILGGRAARRCAHRMRMGCRRINSRLTVWRKTIKMKKRRGLLRKKGELDDKKKSGLS